MPRICSMVARAADRMVNVRYVAWGMAGAILVLFVVPWLDTSKVKSMRYRPTARWFFIIFVLCALGLGWCGGKEPQDMVFTLATDAAGNKIGLGVTTLSQILAFYYFAFFDCLAQGIPWMRRQLF